MQEQLERGGAVASDGQRAGKEEEQELTDGALPSGRAGEGKSCCSAGWAVSSMRLWVGPARAWRNRPNRSAGLLGLGPIARFGPGLGQVLCRTTVWVSGLRFGYRSSRVAGWANGFGLRLRDESRVLG